MRALHVHHDANSLPGLVAEVLADHGVDAESHQVCATSGAQGSPEFPDPTPFDLVVLYGSSWSVDDDRVAHWVQPELDFIRAADTAGVPVLGLCFGGQILATALGGTVGRTAHPEIGWMTVEPVPAPGSGPLIEPGPWLQWHFDAFTVPPGATELARSAAGPQAFRLRRNLGLQFHPEADRAVLEAWIVDDQADLEAAGLPAEVILADADRFRADARGRADRIVAGVLDPAT
jgi:GMP synthase-like glutamine amidotransferase